MGIFHLESVFMPSLLIDILLQPFPIQNGCYRKYMKRTVNQLNLSSHHFQIEITVYHKYHLQLLRQPVKIFLVFQIFLIRRKYESELLRFHGMF